jgi:2-polyprenyl-6-methoxyphenol hydroxylase-like FAD-dependent oxidoreductase
MKAEPHRVDPHNLPFGQEALGAISAGETHATVTVEKADGTTDYLRASFVVGADGGSSTMCKRMGLEFEGFAWSGQVAATNLYDGFTARGWANVHRICSGPARGPAARIDTDKGGLWRVTSPENPALPLDQREDRIRNHHDTRILPDDRDHEIQSFAPYRVPARTCPTCNRGRFVVAGDAAHICTPCGERGLTSGIMDVDRLIAAFAAILSGGNARTGLDAHAAERRKEFLGVSSPFAALMTAMWERSDRDPQTRNAENTTRLAADASSIARAQQAARSRGLIAAPCDRPALRPVRPARAAFFPGFRGGPCDRHGPRFFPGFGAARATGTGRPVSLHRRPWRHFLCGFPAQGFRA